MAIGSVFGEYCISSSQRKCVLVNRNQIDNNMFVPAVRKDFQLYGKNTGGGRNSNRGSRTNLAPRKRSNSMSLSSPYTAHSCPNGMGVPIPRGSPQGYAPAFGSAGAGLSRSLGSGQTTSRRVESPLLRYKMASSTGAKQGASSPWASPKTKPKGTRVEQLKEVPNGSNLAPRRATIGTVVLSKRDYLMRQRKRENTPTESIGTKTNNKLHQHASKQLQEDSQEDSSPQRLRSKAIAVASKSASGAAGPRRARSLKISCVPDHSRPMRKRSASVGVNLDRLPSYTLDVIMEEKETEDILASIERELNSSTGDLKTELIGHETRRPTLNRQLSESSDGRLNSVSERDSTESYGTRCEQDAAQSTEHTGPQSTESHEHVEKEPDDKESQSDNDPHETELNPHKVDRRDSEAQNSEPQPKAAKISGFFGTIMSHFRRKKKNSK